MRLMGALGALGLGMFIGYAKSYRVQARAQALSVFLEELPRLLLQMEYKTLPLSRLVQTLGRADGLLGPFWRLLAPCCRNGGLREPGYRPWRKKRRMAFQKGIWPFYETRGPSFPTRKRRAGKNLPKGCWQS